MNKHTNRALFYINSFINKLNTLLPYFSGKSQDKKYKLLLLGGLGRSGNHLLRGLLDSHPQLWVPPDEDFFVRSLMRNRIDRIRSLFLSEKTLCDFAFKSQKGGHLERVIAGSGEHGEDAHKIINLNCYYHCLKSLYKKRSLFSLCEAHFRALAQATRGTISKDSEYVYRVSFCALEPMLNDILNMGKGLGKMYELSALFIV